MEGDRKATVAADHTQTESEAAPDLVGGTHHDAPVIPRDAYTMRGERARGGLGRIVEASDRRLGRIVAVKELLHDAPAAQRRFEREARLTARLQHPSIVPVYEAGRWPTGELFYAMKLVEGRPLKELIAEKPGLDERLALVPNVIAVADAIAYAHARNVIHRDLKPSNVVVGAFGETMVVDWGLAKDLGEREDDDPFTTAPVGSDETVVGTVLGTPGYMPPEQAAGAPVDQRADVYALGAMLYHVLTGRAPYQGKSSDAVLEEVRASPPRPLLELEPAIPRDLVAIVEKAMARDPSTRYADATAFASDVKKFTAGQLVSAHHYSRLALVWRWVRRHRTLLAITAAFVALIVVLVAISVDRVIHERDVAETRSAALILAQARGAIDRDPTETLAWLKQYPASGTDWNLVHALAAEAASHGVARHVLAHPAAVQCAAYAPDGALVTGSWDGRAREYVDGKVRVIAEHRDWVDMIAFSSDGRMVATAAKNGQYHVIDRRTGARRELTGPIGRVTALRFISGGTQLLAAAEAVSIAGRQGGATLWDVATGVAVELAPPEKYSHATISADGKTIVRATPDGAIELFDLATKTARPFAAHRQFLVTLELIGDQLFTASLDGSVRLWPLDGTQPRTLFDTETRIKHVALSHDQRRFAVVIDGKPLEVIEIADGKVLPNPVTEGARHTAAFSPDGSRIAWGSGATTVHVWNLRTGYVWKLRGHTNFTFALAFSPDGNQLASANRDGQVRVWQLEAGSGSLLDAGDGLVSDVTTAGAFTVGANGALRRWDIDKREPTEVTVLAAKPLRIAVSRDGQRVAVVDSSHALQLFDTAARRVLWTMPPRSIADLLFAPDGRSLVVFGKNGAATVVDAESGTVTRTLKRTHGGMGWGARMSPDGRWLATTAFDRSAELWDLTAPSDGKLLETNGNRNVGNVVFARDAARTAVLAWTTGEIGLWDLPPRESPAVLKFGAEVFAAAFAPDGRTLAAAGAVVVLIDLVSGAYRELGTCEQASGLEYSDDGRLLAAACGDATVRVWNLASGRMRVHRGHHSVVATLTFTPRGELVTSSADSVYVWPTDAGDIPKEASGLAAWFARATSAVAAPRRPAVTP